MQLLCGVGMLVNKNAIDKYSSVKKKKPRCNFANIFIIEHWIFTKFETLAHNRAMDHQKIFGKDMYT